MRWRTSSTSESDTSEEGSKATERSLSRWREPHQRKSKINQQYHTHANSAQKRERLG